MSKETKRHHWSEEEAEGAIGDGKSHWMSPVVEEGNNPGKENPLQETRDGVEGEASD